MSKPVSTCSREWGTTNTVAASDTAARITGIENTHGQVVLSMIAAEANRPMIPPAPATPAQVPIALARSAAGKLVVITDRVTGMIIAAARPATTRNAISGSGLFTNAEARLAAANTTRPMIRIGLRPHRSPIAPIGINSAARARV